MTDIVQKETCEYCNEVIFTSSVYCPNCGGER